MNCLSIILNCKLQYSISTYWDFPPPPPHYCQMVPRKLFQHSEQLNFKQRNVTVCRYNCALPAFINGCGAGPFDHMQENKHGSLISALPLFIQRPSESFLGMALTVERMKICIIQRGRKICFVTEDKLAQVQHGTQMLGTKETVYFRPCSGDVGLKMIICFGY